MKSASLFFWKYETVKHGANPNSRISGGSPKRGMGLRHYPRAIMPRRKNVLDWYKAVPGELRAGNGRWENTERAVTEKIHFLS
jgi:hypothetical protein